MPVDAKNTRRPTRERTTTIGKSHHFLLYLRKSKNSAIREGCLSRPACSNALLPSAEETGACSDFGASVDMFASHSSLTTDYMDDADIRIVYSSCERPSAA